MNKLFYFVVALTLASCTTEIEKVQQINQQNVQRTIRISNEDKPFEYWLNQAHYNSYGQEVIVSVNSGTQITLGAIVPVVNGVSISPNFEVYQDGVLVEIKKVTLGFFWYQVL